MATLEWHKFTSPVIDLNSPVNILLLTMPEAKQNFIVTEIYLYYVAVGGAQTANLTFSLDLDTQDSLHLLWNHTTTAVPQAGRYLRIQPGEGNVSIKFIPPSAPLIHSVTIPTGDVLTGSFTLVGFYI